MLAEDAFQHRLGTRSRLAPDQGLIRKQPQRHRIQRRQAMAARHHQHHLVPSQRHGTEIGRHIARQRALHQTDIIGMEILDDLAAVAGIDMHLDAGMAALEGGQEGR